VTASRSIETLGNPEKTRSEKKIPYAAVPCHFCSGASPWQVVAMPVGPTGGERPQARASRWHPAHVSVNEEAATRDRRSGRNQASVAEKEPLDERRGAKSGGRVPLAPERLRARMIQPYRPPPAAPTRPRFRSLLVAMHLDPGAETVLEAAAALAKETGARVHVLSVLEALMYSPLDLGPFEERDPELHPEASRGMTRAVARLQELGVETVTGGIEFGIAADVIVQQADPARFDMILLGRRGKGSVAAEVMARASIPVLIVPLPR
jgi:nucleotide-binding universal stress UspA family protein